MTTDYDAIVIGGGLGGVIALRELQSRGLRTVLLEAQNRLGGRAYTPKVLGESLDMGGQNIHWSEPLIWAEIMRYQLEVTSTPPYEVYAVREGDDLHRYTAAEGFGQMVSGLTKLTGDHPRSFPQPYRPLLHRDQIERFDGLSIADRLADVELSVDELRWLKPYFGMLSGGEPESMSFAWQVFLTAWAGGIPELLRTRSAFRVVGGLQRLVTMIADDSGADICLESPVTTVVDDGARVVVTTATGEEYAAGIAVVATTGNTLSSIDFVNGLSDLKLTTSKTGAQTPNAFHKLFALIEGPVDAMYLQRPDYAETGGLIHARRDLTRADGLTQVIGFSVDPQLDGGDTDAVAGLFSATLEIPRERIADIVAYNWVADPWSRGGTAFVRPGVVSRWDELAEPEGRLTFAISDFRYGGYNAAVEQGLRAAAESRRILQRGPLN